MPNRLRDWIWTRSPPRGDSQPPEALVKGEYRDAEGSGHGLDFAAATRTELEQVFFLKPRQEFIERAASKQERREELFRRALPQDFPDVLSSDALGPGQDEAGHAVFELPGGPRPWR